MVAVNSAVNIAISSLSSKLATAVTKIKMAATQMGHNYLAILKAL